MRSIFFICQNFEFFFIFFGNATIQKLKEILTSSLRHLKAKSIFLKIDIHKVLSIVIPGPEKKSLKRTHMGTKSKIGLTITLH